MLYRLFNFQNVHTYLCFIHLLYLPEINVFTFIISATKPRTLTSKYFLNLHFIYQYIGLCFPVTVVATGDPHAKSDRPKKEERTLGKLESYSTNDRVYIQIFPLHLRLLIVCPRKCPATDGHDEFLSLFTPMLSRSPKPNFDL